MLLAALNQNILSPIFRKSIERRFLGGPTRFSTFLLMLEIFIVMINTTLEKLKSLKSSDNVDIICDACKKHFTKTKKQLYQNNRKLYTKEGFNHNNTCSKQCQNVLQMKQIKCQCKTCHKEFYYVKHNPQLYCSRRCSNKNRKLSKKTRQKIRTTLSNNYQKKVYLEIKAGLRFDDGKRIYKCICKVCEKSFIHKRPKKACSLKCMKLLNAEAGRKGGRISAKKCNKRSKSEIELFNLISAKYQCLHNQPIFNGWDADIIIPSEKLAILWNGPWHYTKIKANHLLTQVQTRDKIKLDEILRSGYRFIIVKDYKNKMTPIKANEMILSCIKAGEYNLTLL